jgi:hypothetical protein
MATTAWSAELEIAAVSDWRLGHLDLIWGRKVPRDVIHKRWIEF